jgi:single-strand DNA-binding protein
LANFNKVIMCGNTTRDIDTSFTRGDTTIAKFGIAVNRKFRRGDGENVEEVMFIDLTAFGRTAEILAKHVNKGDNLLIDGRLQFDQWNDKQTGDRRSKHSVVVENFQFMNNKQDGERQQRNDPPPQRNQNNEPPAMGGDDDIPF